MIRRLSAIVASCLAGALLFASVAFAQVPSITGPYNVDLGALITNTAQGAATVNSAAQTNLVYHGVVCTFNQSSHTGTPSTTFAVQGYDKASNSWLTLGTSGAITADATPTDVVVYPGAVATAVPTGMIIVGLHLPRQWRITETVAGTTPVVNGTVGCNYLN